MNTIFINLKFKFQISKQITITPHINNCLEFKFCLGFENLNLLEKGGDLNAAR